MQMMCNPTFDYGPAPWHRDIHPIDMGPMQSMQDSLVEDGPNYMQWNIPLYDDSVFWIVPGSHTRINTEAEIAACWRTPACRFPAASRSSCARATCWFTSTI